MKPAERRQWRRQARRVTRGPVVGQFFWTPAEARAFLRRLDGRYTALGAEIASAAGYVEHGSGGGTTPVVSAAFLTGWSGQLGRWRAWLQSVCSGDEADPCRTWADGVGLNGPRGWLGTAEGYEAELRTWQTEFERTSGLTSAVPRDPLQEPTFQLPSIGGGGLSLAVVAIGGLVIGGVVVYYATTAAAGASALSSWGEGEGAPA